YYVRRAGPQRVISDDPAVEVAIFRQRTSRVMMAVVNPYPQRALGLAAIALVAFVLQSREDRALAERPRPAQPPDNVKTERRRHHQRKRPADVAQTPAGQPRPEVFGNFGLGLIEFGRARTITPRRGAQREDQSRHADQKNDCRNKRKVHRIADCGLRIADCGDWPQSHRDTEKERGKDGEIARIERRFFSLPPSLFLFISVSLCLCG